MATTNSTDKSLNSYVGQSESNSGIYESYYVNTGNKKKNKNNLPVLNDTFTIDNKSKVVNAKLLNWDDAILKEGKDIDASLNGDQTYKIYGHPDKWIYDYQQEYNNCGLDSCLNVLSMAGIKDIVEVTPSYSQYLSTPIIKTQKVNVWDDENSCWETKTVETTTYPKAPKETEDEFLLWAVQNSKNDDKWTRDKYNGIEQIIGETEDYVLHSKNYYEYKTVDDLKDEPTKVGGTTNKHWENTLNYWGVESEKSILTVKKLDPVDTTPNTIQDDPPTEYVDEKTGIKYYKRIKVTQTSSADGKTVTTETTITLLDATSYEAEKKEEKVVRTETTTNVVTKTNTAIYDFLETYEGIIENGQGVIIGGYGNAFKGKEGGPHAITIVGLVKGDIETFHTETIIKDGDRTYPTFIGESSYSEDIVGVYVIETGGFLGNKEGAQFITIDMLYKFLTNNGTQDTSNSQMCVTELNIRSWADNMNLVGNNDKNILEGNRGNNGIWGGRGNDVLYGDAGDDTLYGEEGNDSLHGGEGNDVLNGGSGNDTYIFHGDDKSSNDLIITGSGKDDIQFDTTLIQDNEGQYYSYDIEDIATMRYQNRDGNLVIEYNVDVYKVDIETGRKTDTDEHYVNTITVQNYFKKSLYSSIKNVIHTQYNSVNDVTLDFLKDFIQRGAIDYYTYAQKSNKITGSKFMDSIVGGSKNDTISAGDGNDYIDGGAGNDSIKGGSGDDTIMGSHGNDKIYGEKGINTIIYEENYSGNDTIYSGSGQDYINMTAVSRDDLIYAKSGNNLVITYNKTDGSSITITNYFNKKGKTSVKELRLNGSTLDLVKEYNDILSQVVVNKVKKDGALIGGDGYDYLIGGNADDSLSGGLGNDTLYGGNGNDTLNGGYGSDKLYGQAGDNTYVFDNHALGEDTIYYSGNGKSTLDFSDTDLVFSSKGVENAVDEYSYTKSGNNLIINYATTDEEYGNSSITISNFFKAKGEFAITNSDGSEFDLKNATIYMNGKETSKNKITGSQYNDYIIGYDYNDTLKGGNGDDTIVGGKGNDNITGGAGHNVIEYAKGDGQDTINLTKNENLDIKLTGFDSTDKLTYNIVKNDLVIGIVSEKGVETKLLTIKNLGKKDVTTASGSVNLYLNGDFAMDLREGNYLATYNSFTAKKYSYTGTWHSEKIDASSLNSETVKKNKGANINAGAGHDTIIGSEYNDTIKGGDGNDVIYTGTGTNTVDGGNGSDTYYIFEGLANTAEKTTIKDTGKGVDDIDTVIISEEYTNLLFSEDAGKSQIWFNIDRAGKITNSFNIVDKDGNTATLTGIEKLVANGGTANDTSDDYYYNYTSENLKSEVVSWLTEKGYADVNSAMKNAKADDKYDLLEIFSNTNYWVQET